MNGFPSLAMDHSVGGLSRLWKQRLDSCVTQDELHQARSLAAVPSFSFFFLLITSAVIATLGLISNSAAVVIGAMIVAPLMDPILSLAFGIAMGETKLIAKALFTIVIGVALVVLTAVLIANGLGTNFVQSEIYGRTTPNLIDLGIALAAAIAAAYCSVRTRLSSSIAGVAIAVALVPPLCVTGIGLTLGESAVAMFGRGAVAGLSNRITEGSFLLFLVNLIGIAFAAVIVFLLHGYGSMRRSGRSLLVTLALIGLVSLPLSDSLNDFRLARVLSSEFEFLKQEKVSSIKSDPQEAMLWTNVQIVYSNLEVKGRSAVFDLVLNVPQSLNKQALLEPLYDSLRDRAEALGLNQLDLNINVVPSSIFRYKDKDPDSMS